MSYITKILSRPTNKPYRTRDLLDHRPCLDSDGLLMFGPGDVENPRNWSVRRRFVITATTVFLVMNATFASSAPSGCFPSIMEHFHVSEEAAGLTITLFLLGYCAGPLIFAPLSELYGRRFVFYCTFSSYLAFNFLCAFAPNFGALLVGRFLTGTFVSAPLSNGPGLLADIWNPVERGMAMGGFSAMMFVGPALGPIIAGFLQLKKDWQWVFYVLLMLGGFSGIFMLTIPESHGPTILRIKARRIRSLKIPGYENVKAPSELLTPREEFKKALTRPWQIFFDPISFLCNIYLSVVYMLLYMLFTIYPIVFQEKRHWNAGVGQLPLLGVTVGSALGSIFVILDSKRQERKEKRVGKLEAEDRLPIAIVGGFLFAISMFWFAWTANFNSVHWAVPTVAGVFLLASLLFLFVGFLNYLVDTYLMFAASAIAANTIARSACGAAAPLFTEQMFHAMGVGGGGSLIGGVACLLAVIPLAFYKYGKNIRLRSKFAPTGRDNELHQRDEEADPAGEAQSESGSESDSDDDDSASETEDEGEHAAPSDDGSSTAAGSDNMHSEKEKEKELKAKSPGLFRKKTNTDSGNLSEK